MEDTVTISKDEYVELLRESIILTALESGGVDNWDWYGASIHDFVKDSVQYYMDKYEEKFLKWVCENKDSDQTVDDFIEEMGIEDCVDFELTL